MNKVKEFEEKKLTGGDIREGIFVLYPGSNNSGKHQCAAVIIEVDCSRKLFWIRLLSNMSEFSEPFDFEEKPLSPYSRKQMRVLSLADALKYIETRLKELRSYTDRSRSRESTDQLIKELSEFKEKLEREEQVLVP